MRKLRSVLYTVFVAIGWTLLISKLVSLTFGLKEWLSSDMRWAVCYELIILFAVSLGMFIYNRFFVGKQTSSNAIEDETLKATICELRDKLSKKAIVFRSARAEQMPQGYVSCLGRVTWQLPGEEWPTDASGDRLEPLATIFVPDLPGVPPALRNVALITIFAPEEAWAEDPDVPQLGCVIRTYASLSELEPCNYESTVWNTCILTPEAVEHDMPGGGCCGGGDALWETSVELEDKHRLEYETHVCDAEYYTHEMRKFPAGYFSSPTLYATYETHKMGGYPTFIQDGDESADYPFIMQIHYDDEAGLSIADAGCYYFFYNAEQNDWIVSADTY